MKLVALVSGGKDSIFSVIKAMSLGHEILALLTMYTFTERDSYSF
jgi:diphthamide synthase (EF-2-diphthine--ammonia ligase)